MVKTERASCMLSIFNHANAIAEFYREHGIAAVAIDSKTPSSLRKETY